MTLNLSICRADEVIVLVKDADKSGSPFDAVISLEHPGIGGLTSSQGRAPRLAEEIGSEWQGKQLILVCYDVEHDRFGVPVPDRNIVTDAMAFADKRMPADRPLNLLIHCHGGKARSTALGLVLLLRHNGTTIDQSIAELLRVRPIAAPNLALVKHGDDALGLGGALVAAIESHAEITARREELEVRRNYQVESRRFGAPTP